MAPPDRPATYKDAGVDIDAQERTIQEFKGAVEATHGPEVLSGIGLFANLFKPDLSDYEEPVLVASTDGVGTKLKLAFATGRHETIGIDLVAMCVNDLLTLGAKPLFFLDYLATGKLMPDVAADVVRSIAKGCEMAHCALIGGEIAEMAGFYNKDEYDLAGFAVGIADRKKIIDGSTVKAGDVVIGLASSGLHSNGYSLARMVILAMAGLSVDDELEGCGRTVGEEMLEPTKIYVDCINTILAEAQVRAIANITGGGFYDNIKRVLPDGLAAAIDTGAWEIPPVFQFIQGRGRVEPHEMYRTFNMGIGMVLIADDPNAAKVIQTAQQRGCPAWRIGTVRESGGDEPVVVNF